MRQIPTRDAVGCVLCHDITQIVRGVTKDPAFRKGHVVRDEDIPVLLSMGKDSIFVWEQKEGMLHENDAAEILCELCKGDHMRASEAREGKIEVIAECDGLLTVDVDKLWRVNSLGEMMIATRHSKTPVKRDEKLAGTRVIPLVIEKEKMERARAIGGGVPILSLKPFGRKRAAIIATGNEIFHGRIEDTFTPVVVEKLYEFGVEIVDKSVTNDDPQRTSAAILSALDKRVDLVVCTGGMSVDPDDRTPLAIRNTGAEIITYGAPVLPGAMFMLAYHEGRIPILGLPGCVMYARRTIFDLVLPRLVADEKITAEDLALLGHGGLCLSCPSCVYPNCGFGKGS